MARAIWKGQIVLGQQNVAVRMYSAIEDRKVHFRLLHEKDLAPVHQKIVRKTDGKEVPKQDRLKAFPIGKETAVILRPDELEELEAEAAREIHLCRFVPRTAVSDQWYDRPYYLGPDDDASSYFALASAIEKEGVIGIARWVMRRKHYVGALTAVDGYLTMITLRRAEQVLALPSLKMPVAHKPSEQELKLAKQLVSAISDKFDPGLWQDEYHERVCRLIEAKAKGETIKLERPKPKQATGQLADVLRKSLSGVKERKVA
jgi:DNA end-binding protein Ku